MNLDEKQPVFNHVLLKDLRIKKNLSVYELGKLSGVNESYIHKLEKAKMNRPTFSVVASLALALETSTDSFIRPFSL